MMRMPVLALVARDFGDSQGFFIDHQMLKKGFKNKQNQKTRILHRQNGNKPKPDTGKALAWPWMQKNQMLTATGKNYSADEA